MEFIFDSKEMGRSFTDISRDGREEGGVEMEGRGEREL